MTNFFEKISALCQSASKRKQAELINNEIAAIEAKKAELQAKQAQLLGKAIAKKDVKETSAKSKANATCSKDELIINVAANVQVKDVCRNIERKLQRNLSASNADDKQLLFNHLFYFYCLKHVNTLPIVHGKNKDYHINDYVMQRTNSVINDVTCHIHFDK
jgi:hypothetical protein